MTTQIIEYNKTDAALAELSQRYTKAVYDVATSKGMDEAKVARAELRGYRVNLEKTRVEIKAPALERCRLIDAEAKRITAVLVDLEEPIDEQIKKEEKRKEEEAMAKVMAEQRRKDGIQVLIEAIRGRALVLAGKPSIAIANALEVLEATEITEAEFMEFQAEARTALDAAIVRVRELHEAAIAHEAEAIRIKAEREELAKLRAEAEARDRERQAEIADENRKRAEEDRIAREKIAEEQRASRAKIEAEERAAQAERQARERVDFERRKAEQAARDAEEARLNAERERQDAERREIARKANEVMDAKALLIAFRQRFGHVEEFAQVVMAIDACIPKKRKAA